MKCLSWNWIRREIVKELKEIITVGKELLVYEIKRHVFPTAPSPTVTHFMNLEALIFVKNWASDLLLFLEDLNHVSCWSSMLIFLPLTNSPLFDTKPGHFWRFFSETLEEKCKSGKSNVGNRKPLRKGEEQIIWWRMEEIKRENGP